MKPEDHDALMAILKGRLTVVMDNDYGYYGDVSVVATVYLDGVDILSNSSYVNAQSYSSCSCGDCDK